MIASDGPGGTVMLFTEKFTSPVATFATRNVASMSVLAPFAVQSVAHSSMLFTAVFSFLPFLVFFLFSSFSLPPPPPNSAHPPKNTAADARATAPENST